MHASGNPHVLCMDEMWKWFLEYCVLNSAYKGCDLPLYLTVDKQTGNTLLPVKENYPYYFVTYKLQKVRRQATFMKQPSLRAPPSMKQRRTKTRKSRNSLKRVRVGDSFQRRTSSCRCHSNPTAKLPRITIRYFRSLKERKKAMF